jgi:hypothetical protein
MNHARPAAASSRRDFLRAAATASFIGAAAHPLAAWAAANRPKRVMLRSGWQFVNIGDIGHTPGGLHLLEQYLPDAEVTLWIAHTTDAIDAMLGTRFPKVKIVKGTIDPKTLAVTGDALKVALNETDVLGVTLGDINDNLAALLSNAKFVFTRDTLSLAAMKKAGMKGPAVGFAPDATFAIDVRDDKKAVPFLASLGLEEQKFICAVPRLRFTPYRHFTPEQIKQREAVNEQFAEADHKKLRDALSAVVRKTGKKVLVCPEMTYQLEVIDKLVIDPLPADVKPHVMKRGTFWLPDEAASVYARAAAVVSFEMHSPIIALAAGTPAVYLRQPTDTRKGQMMRDIGLPEWIHEIDDVTGEQIGATLLAILADTPAAKAKVTKAMATVAARYGEAFGVIGKVLG